MAIAETSCQPLVIMCAPMFIALVGHSAMHPGTPQHITKVPLDTRLILLHTAQPGLLQLVVTSIHYLHWAHLAQHAITTLRLLPLLTAVTAPRLVTHLVPAIPHAAVIPHSPPAVAAQYLAIPYIILINQRNLYVRASWLTNSAIFFS